MEKTQKASETNVSPVSPAVKLDELVGSLLSFLAADDGRFARFLSATGMTIDGLRSAAAAPGFAECLLDYLCGDSKLLLAYSDETGVDPRAIDRLRCSMTPAFDP